MPTLNKIFDKCGVALYQNESLDLDHYYQEPYQDEGDEIKVIGEPFETDKSKKIRKYDLYVEDRTFSNFSFFMDGSRRTYKIGDIVIYLSKQSITTCVLLMMLIRCMLAALWHRLCLTRLLMLPASNAHIF